jgi:hypothetical protein
MRAYCGSVCRGGDVSPVRRHELRTRGITLSCVPLWKMPKKRMEDRWEYVDAVVRGEREKGRCGRDAHSGSWGTGTGRSTRNQRK